MRVFVAMDITEPVRASLRDFVARLPKTPAAKWVRPESMHLTLKFIGEVKPEVVEVIESTLRSVPFAAPVAVRFHGTGYFPRESRPSVLWAGVEASENLAELAGSIDRSCAAAGIAGETRAYSPHLTLARFKTPEAQRDHPHRTHGFWGRADRRISFVPERAEDNRRRVHPPGNVSRTEPRPKRKMKTRRQNFDLLAEITSGGAAGVMAGSRAAVANVPKGHS
jgi:2'-5' RNA ligase